MSHTAPEIREKTASETRNIAIDMSGKLDEGELMIGVPTVSELVTSDLTLTNKAVNDAEMIINKKTVPAGRALVCTVSGGTAGVEYSIFMQAAGTDATASQTPTAVVRLKVISDSGS